MSDAIFGDTLQAIRRLLRSRAFTATVIACLSLALAACVAAFTLVNAVVLRPLPGPDPDRVVEVQYAHIARGLSGLPLPGSDATALADGSSCFEAFALVHQMAGSLLTTSDAIQVQIAAVTPDFFRVFGEKTALGHDFALGDRTSARSDSAIISDRLWRTQYRGDRAVVGQVVHIDGVSYTVTGVMPAAFRLPQDETDVWIPLILTPDGSGRSTYRDASAFRCMARLKDGVTAQQAQMQLAGILSRLNEAPFRQHPFFQGLSVSVQAARAQAIASSASVLSTLGISVLCVLLIACSNVANMMLVRSGVSSREFAIRYAMGATRMQLIRLVLVESILVAVAAGVIGLLLGYWCIQKVLAVAPWRMASSADAVIDWRVVAFSLVLSFVAAMLSGTLPALRASRRSVVCALRDGDRGMATVASQRLRHLLVSLEVGLTFVLLVGVGLLLQSYVKLQHVDLSLDPDGVTAMDVQLPQVRYGDVDSIVAFSDRVLTQLEPNGAVAVTARDGVNMNVLTEGMSQDEVQGAFVRQIPFLGDLMGALRLRLVAGRWFDQNERAGSGRVAVVNENLVQQYLHGQEALGSLLTMGGVQYKIIGVVHNAMDRGPVARYAAVAYVPLDQQSYPVRDLRVVVRVRNGPHLDATAQCRASLRVADPALAAIRIAPLTVILGDTFASQRLLLALASGFGACALLLAVVGLYGVTGYQVSQRTHEIGIRAAIGAGASDIITLVAQRSLTYVAIGLILGLAAAVGLTRFLQSQLYGVSPLDIPTLFGVSLLVLGVACAASVVPAWRATHISPAEALRYE